MIGLIVAMSPERVIGVEGRLPWHYPADLVRFKRTTLGATVIMGRRTWASLPRRPLPGRRNLVITSSPLEGVETFAGLDEALAAVRGDAWVIGGAQLYAAALDRVDLLDLTYVPDALPADAPGVVLFPALDPARFEVVSPRRPLAEDPRLEHEVLRRRADP